MAATADPRAKPPPAHHLQPWARQQQQQPRAHRARAPAHQTVEESASSVGARDRRRSSSEYSRRSSGGDGSEDLRGKLVGHLRDAADRPRVAEPSPPLPPPPPKAASQQPETEREPSQELKAPPQEQEQQPQAEVPDKPWKLRERTRRRPASLTSWPSAAPSRRRKRAPFSVSLAPEEIEEDIYALTGGRPRRRPRKRPRAVQQKLDSLFPGMWLAEVTADDYKVPEPEEE
ncbi:uncharacterized protein [Lolium perenne]|uniref:uncharacterized protein n=1 Tax=Lolium perenne TaxID=4522 RepID=UPI0021EAFB84|nr:uncharacterized protein LOC127327461 [Lolium perenne]